MGRTKETQPEGEQAQIEHRLGQLEQPPLPKLRACSGHIGVAFRANRLEEDRPEDVHALPCCFICKLAIGYTECVPQDL